MVPQNSKKFLYLECMTSYELTVVNFLQKFRVCGKQTLMTPFTLVLLTHQVSMFMSRQLKCRDFST